MPSGIIRNVQATSPNTIDRARTARCPRCGYDQRGAISTWTESCPLNGVCSECGLEWRWAEVFNPRLHRPRWCVEYGRVIAFPWRCVKTLCVSFWPWRFWWGLQMSHEARWLRIAAYLLVIFLAVYAAFAFEVGRVAYQSWRAHDSSLTGMEQFWSRLSPTQVQKLAGKGHFPQSDIVSTRVSMLQVVGLAAVKPWSSRSPGVEVFQDGTQRPYPDTPLRCFSSRFNLTGSSPFARCREVFSIFLFPVWFSLLMPATFLLLPISRRVSRVRWNHIIRISMYNSVWILLPFVWWILLPPRLSDYPNHWVSVAFVAFVACPLILTTCWGAAISRHLRMVSPWRTALALAAIAWLLPMLCGYFWVIVEMRPDWFMSN